MKNNIQQLTNDELLEALKDSNEGPNYSELPDVFRFVDEFKLTSGPFLVQISTLYKLYFSWSQNPLNSSKFRIIINQLLPFKNTQSRLLLNKSPRELLGTLYKEDNKKSRRLTSGTFKKHFETYLQTFEIKKGKLYLKARLFFDVYQKWLLDNKKTKATGFGFVNFTSYMRLYLPHKKDKQAFYFGVDPIFLTHLTDEQKLQCLSPKGRRNAVKKEKK